MNALSTTAPCVTFLSQRRELPACTRQAHMEMSGMSASIVAKRTGIRPATGNTRKRGIEDVEQRHSITFLFSYAPLFKYRQRGWQNLQILREQFTAYMDVFCLKCLLLKQTLQVGLSAYFHNVFIKRYLAVQKMPF